MGVVGLMDAPWHGAQRGAGTAVQPSMAPCTGSSIKGAPSFPQDVSL